MGANPTSEEFERAEDSLEEYLGPNRPPKGAAAVIIDVGELLEHSTEEFEVLALVAATHPRIRPSVWVLQFLLDEANSHDGISDTVKAELAARIAEFSVVKPENLEEDAACQSSVKDLVIRIATKTAAMIAEDAARGEWVDLVVDPATGVASFPQ